MKKDYLNLSESRHTIISYLFGYSTVKLKSYSLCARVAIYSTPSIPISNYTLLVVKKSLLSYLRWNKLKIGDFNLNLKICRS